MLRLALLFSCLAAAAHAAPDTERVFSNFAGGVVKIQIVGERSESKSVIGTGFFVGNRRLVLTNYHVVSKAIFDPDTHRAELVHADESVAAVRVLGVDVVHDLAVLEVRGAGGGTPFQLASEPVQQGARIYSLGHPHDLGLAIVEGTFNGLLDQSFFDKIHLTISLNPGMSGGPTIDESGAVVGVNVATAGNQVSFVIPAARGLALIERVSAPSFAAAEDLREEVRLQLIEYQENLLAEVQRAGDLGNARLGRYSVPGEFAAFLDCWGDDVEEDDALFRASVLECSTRDSIFVEGNVALGSLAFRHRLITSDALDRFRFHSLYTSMFSEGFGHGWASSDDVTAYACDTDYVAHASLVMKTVFCARRYQNLEQLYDVIFKTAILGSPSEGLESSLRLSGVSFETGRRVAALFLRAIRPGSE